MTAKQTYILWVMERFRPEISAIFRFCPDRDRAEFLDSIAPDIHLNLIKTWGKQQLDISAPHSIRVWAKQLSLHDRMHLRNIPPWLKELFSSI